MPRYLRILAIAGWLLFTAGLVGFVFVYLRYGGSSVPRARWRSSWGRPRWVTFRDPEGRFLIEYPSDWDMSAPFARFTRHRVGDLVQVDTLALRRANPTGLLVVIRYAAPRPLTADEWFAKTRPDGPLKDAFGESILQRERTRLAGVPALKVNAEGIVAEHRYRLESWFVPDGANAYRITIGAPVSGFDQVSPTLYRMVRSFRFTQPIAPRPAPGS